MNNTSNYYIINIDRDFKSNQYGDGPYIEFIDKKIRIKINIKYYDEKNNNLIVHVPEFNETMVLKDEPNIQAFKENLNKEWIEWDKKYGESMDEDRSDYQPWCYLSLKALAIDANIIKSPHDNDIYVLFDNDGSERLIKSWD